MEGVDLYFENIKGERREIAIQLHQFILSYEGFYPRIRYKIPFYYRKSWVCYLNVPKKGGVELAFIKANKLLKSRLNLNFKDRKMVASITYFKKEEIDYEIIHEVILEALTYDE